MSNRGLGPTLDAKHTYILSLHAYSDPLIWDPFWVLFPGNPRGVPPVWDPSGVVLDPFGPFCPFCSIVQLFGYPRILTSNTWGEGVCCATRATLMRNRFPVKPP